MVTVHKVNTRSRPETRRFLQLPYRLYKEYPLWVPPLLIGARIQMDPDKHPFYEHSKAAFFLAVQDVGRIVLLYSEMEKTIRENDFLHAELVHITQTATQMRSDLENEDGVPYKNHREYLG